MTGESNNAEVSDRSMARAESGPRDKPGVLKAILQRECEGLPLNHATVLKDDRCLHSDILRLFGSWDVAMRASGIDPDSVRRHRRWTRQSVIQRICELAAEGRPLNAAAVQRSEAALPSAASRFFPSWHDALQAAGIDQARWRKRVPTWTRKRVIRGIQQIHAGGGKVNHAALGHNSISRAGVLLFGSWDAALQAAGLDPDDIRVYRKPWTPDEVIQEIQRKHRRGEALNAKDVSSYSLRRSGKAFFGSWDAALTTAGLDPAKIRKNNSRGRLQRR